MEIKQDLAALYVNKAHGTIHATGLQLLRIATLKGLMRVEGTTSLGIP